MVSKNKHLAVLLAAASLTAVAVSAQAASYTITLNDLPYIDANGTYGQTIPSGYQPSELAGSGITIGFGSTDGLFYGASAPIGTNDATYAVTGAGTGASLSGDTITFNQPVYITSVYTSAYYIPDGSTAATTLASRTMTMNGYTNTTDTTAAKTVSPLLSLHGEAWRATMTWREVTDFGTTPITKLTWSAPGFGEIDQITVSTTPLARIPGDFNGNGQVDDGDYTIWADTYDQWGDPAYVGLTNDVGQYKFIHGVDLRADANNSGFIDDGDYTSWADNYGVGAPLASAAAAVPEPASMSLLIIGSSLLLRRRK